MNLSSKNLGLKINRSLTFSNKGRFRKRPHQLIKGGYNFIDLCQACFLAQWVLFESNTHGITTCLCTKYLYCVEYSSKSEKLMDCQLFHKHWFLGGGRGGTFSLHDKTVKLKWTQFTLFQSQNQNNDVLYYIGQTASATLKFLNK